MNNPHHWELDSRCTWAAFMDDDMLGRHKITCSLLIVAVEGLVIGANFGLGFIAWIFNELRLIMIDGLKGEIFELWRDVLYQLSGLTYKPSQFPSTFFFLLLPLHPFGRKSLLFKILHYAKKCDLYVNISFKFKHFYRSRAQTQNVYAQHYPLMLPRFNFFPGKIKKFLQ